MAIEPKILISIGSTEVLSINKMVLHQDIGSHHFLELICRMDSLEDTTKEMSTDSKNHLGEKLTMSIEPQTMYENYGKLLFNGIVTKLDSTLASSTGGQDLVRITARSTSIIADDGPNYDSFYESTLTEIVDANFRGYDTSKLDIINNPAFTDPIHYSVQNGDSTYQYISNLASQYGEWFYFNGKSLVFGNDTTAAELTLTYGLDLKQYAMELNPVPKKFTYYSNDYLTGENHSKSSSELNGATSGYNGFTASKGEQIYTKDTAVFVNTFNDANHKNRFDKLVALHRQASEVNEVIIKGKSDNPGVCLGGIIAIEGATTAAGKFRITKVKHVTDKQGEYQNSFEGVTADINVSPLANLSSFPHSDTQVAKVFDNVDPDGMGRVQVQFPWQVARGQNTPWARVMTPHSGADKGFHFIPEIGEEVLIGFEGGNAERPYVMGSLYTGINKPKGWQTDANNIKAIRTRSGHTIELDDTDGKEKISIYDNKGSIILFDTKKKSLTINSAETIDIGAKNINLVAEENINLKSKGSIVHAAEKDITILSEGNTVIQATGDATMTSDGEVYIEASKNASLLGKNVIAEGKTGATLKGAQTNVQGQITAVQGAAGKIDIT